MGRKTQPGTAVATVEPPTARVVGRVITTKEAGEIVKKVAADELRRAKAEQKERQGEIQRTVGGQVQRVDESVIQQARALMARLALIAKKKTDNYASAGNSALIGIVKKMGAVVGELEAFALTDKASGLFEDIHDTDYKGCAYHGASENPLLFAGPKAREAAEAALAGYTIVDEPKRKRGKNATEGRVPATRTVEELSEHADAVENGDIDDEDEDNDDFDVAGDEDTEILEEGE
jgi:hypothetical protein